VNVALTQFSQTLHFAKDGLAATGNASSGATCLGAWAPACRVAVYDTTVGSEVFNGTTDAQGSIVHTGIQTHNYNVTVFGEPVVFSFMATSTYPSLDVRWSSPPSVPMWRSQYNATNTSIEMMYSDPSPANVTFEIKDTGNGSLMYCQTYTGTSATRIWSPPNGSHSYQIRITADRATGRVGGTNFMMVQKNTTAPLIFLFPIDPLVQEVLLMVFLMVFIGLFGYVHAPAGALMTSITAAFFNFVGWLTIPWYWVQLVLLVSFLATVTSGPEV
jgi:hypothetical protein